MKELDIIIPVTLEGDGTTAAQIAQSVIDQNKLYGFTKFVFIAPGKGWRSTVTPPIEHYEKLAHTYVQIQEILAPYNLECGWWCTTTIKSGPSDDFNLIVRVDGSTSPFGNCPLNPDFRKYFSSCVAKFAQIAKPSFIFFEDDYSVHASSDYGCFCEHHLNEFARRQRRYYSRDELREIFTSDSEDRFELIRAWRELMRDSLVGLSEAVRNAVDVKTPEIPIGYMQAGSADTDGDCTEAVCRALAGPNHVPFSRLFGTFYNGGDTKEIPEMLFHPLYSKQHINGKFKFYHESDTYPHTRFYTSGKQMRTMMAAAYSFGFDGSTFQTQQLSDNPNEDPAYGKMFARERKKFNALNHVAKQCDLRGVEVGYDPFWNTADHSYRALRPFWTKSLCMFGIPFQSLESDVVFWDDIQAKRRSDEEVIAVLSKNLFLDGAAAKELYERGYGEYLGVSIGENLSVGRYVYDLGAHDIIRDGFAVDSVGRTMHPAHGYSCKGNGHLLKITVTDPACEILSDEYTFESNYVGPTMTRFVNKLGGKVVIMGMTIEGNGSQALLNYRRQKLMQEQLVWCCDKYAFAKDDPGVYVIMNEAKDEDCGFKGMLTLINLCEDELDEVKLHLPPEWRGCEYRILDRNGIWNKAEYSATDDGIVLAHELRYSDPMCILVV